jgi:DNA-binding GntR family transcriptional regulator
VPSGLPRMRSVEVVSALRADIVNGIFEQGQRLTEEALSDRYGVSRIPIREALRTLQSEGFVRVAPYKHTTVAVLAADEATDLLEVRAALEETAIRRAAKAPRPLLATAEDILARGTEAVAAGRLHELPQLNTDLHTALVEVSGNTSLVAIHQLIRHKIQWVYTSNIDRRAADSWREHEAIIAAVVDGNSELAALLIRAHIAQSALHYSYRSASVAE